ncbi:FixJ family two-component response regulator [Nitrobacteraceae bacterium AZCC 1564]
MRSMGFSVEAFSCGPDFLNSPNVGCTACLIADVHMPEMTGLDLYHHLSSHGHVIPTILITGYPSEGVRALALEAGVISYLVKPFTESDLLDSVRDALDQKK